MIHQRAYHQSGKEGPNMKHSLSALGLSLFVAFATVLGALTATPTLAGDKDPLFVNLVSDDAHSATMALHFAKSMQEQGHPVTVFFNNKGVLVASKAHASTYPDQQKNIASLSGSGAMLIACAHCMKYYGVADTTLVTGIVVGTPAMLSKQLFQDGTKTLTW
jgi:sulfur relay (sulfurtransferase) complex TusBCD TusD component (DsrE family)